MTTRERLFVHVTWGIQALFVVGSIAGLFLVGVFPPFIRILWNEPGYFSIWA